MKRLEDTTISPSSPTVSALKRAGEIALNCCKILFFLALGVAFMIYN
jgi:hypothetical protein